jgi:hypothetical protein
MDLFQAIQLMKHLAPWYQWLVRVLATLQVGIILYGSELKLELLKFLKDEA